MCKSTALLILTLSATIGVANAGWKNFLCPTATNSSVYFKCHDDCLHQHGAAFGKCGDMEVDDYNCYCGDLDGKVHPESLHCADPSKKANYDLLCTVDCQCSHGAMGGVCDYDLKACKCNGSNRINTLCPYFDVEGFALFTAEMAGMEGLVGYFTRPYLPSNYPFKPHRGPYRYTTTTPEPIPDDVPF